MTIRFGRILGLATLVLAGWIDAAVALTVNCERYSNSTNGFTSKAAMESWYPKTVRFSHSEFTAPKNNSKKLVEKIETRGMGAGGSVKIIWQLLPNGKLIATLPSKAGYQSPSPGRYKCDKNALDVRAANADDKKNNGNKSAVAPKKSEKDQPKTKLEKAKSTCTELGFTSGTEKHGDCVLKLME